MASMVYDKFVIVMDEPENHLHPKLQRSLLPSLVKAFPEVQFIISTHNPFMVTSVPDSNVFMLSYNELNSVDSTELDLINRSGSSNEILRDVLGVETTLPIWAEEKLEVAVNKIKGQEVNASSLKQLKNDLNEVGLSDYFPEALDRVIGGANSD